jgi:hypothetical protein
MRTAAMIVVTCLLFVAGCGGHKNPIDGKYQDAKSSLLTFTFDSGKCEISFVGMTKQTTYEISGNKVALHNPNGSVESVLTIQTDGSLVDTFSGNKLVRAP